MGGRLSKEKPWRRWSALLQELRHRKRSERAERFFSVTPSPSAFRESTGATMSPERSGQEKAGTIFVRQCSFTTARANNAFSFNLVNLNDNTALPFHGVFHKMFHIPSPLL
jgi:hypothetical protein